MGDNRLSLASASVGIMDDIIHGALFAPPITGDLLQDRIDSLHPPADERDELPDIVDDPEVPCLQITAEQYRARCTLGCTQARLGLLFLTSCSATAHLIISRA